MVAGKTKGSWRRAAVAVAAVVASVAASAAGPAAAVGLDGMWDLPAGVSVETLARRYSHEAAEETEVLLEEGPAGKCVANVPNVVGVLPSSCCGEMRCPKSDGVCCTGNSHCCPAGHICIQGDPGTPPGCLDVLHKKIPVAVHKLMRQHKLDVKLVTPPKAKAAIPGHRPNGRLNYEDALAPRHRNVLAQHRIAETTMYHRNQDGDVKAKTERKNFVLPNLPGFPTVPESAISNAEVDPSTLTKEQLAEKKAVADGKINWVAPDGVKGTGGGVQQGGDSPVGLKAYGTDAVVMLPGEGVKGDLPKPDINRAQAELDERGIHGTVASVSVVRAPTTMAKAAPAGEARFREVRGSAAYAPRRSRREEDQGAAALARLFPPDPESATHDPPSPPSEEEKTLARIAAQLEKVNRMRGELRAELQGMQGVQVPPLAGV